MSTDNYHSSLLPDSLSDILKTVGDKIENSYSLYTINLTLCFAYNESSDSVQKTLAKGDRQ